MGREGFLAAHTSFEGEFVRVLVTNDDGIDSPGLFALARAASSLDWEVLVAAPST
ncbi:MAG TPA: 5'/3'-nucleotidase SurE, partial [Lentzea sp.]